MSHWPPRPRLSASFYKAHGLGNDYLVFEEGDDWLANPENVRRVCHRTMGAGSDGIVVLLAGDRVRLRMFNPDGGEFERSGNGLRVLASYLMRADADVREMDVEVGGARIRMVGHGRVRGTYDVSVDMGRASMGPSAVSLDPGALDAVGCLPGPSGEGLRVAPVSVGNPHVVVLCEDESDLSEVRLAEIGPFVAEHPAIENGTNVQLAIADGEGKCRALIWERGVGRTSASGTSACAVAVAMVASGALAVGDVAVRMPGGVLNVHVSSELDVVLRGPVEEVMSGRISCATVLSDDPGLRS
ncbi:MAG: diaminopimelate epimerase [Gemmatimonadetes bacterium]|nr:diaminopimelate epimerase [Gemmatimonadota bacterium]NNL30538.1 diaminopimelate epimerase [Gemmatimonadota bacterium]